MTNTAGHNPVLWLPCNALADLAFERSPVGNPKMELLPENRKVQFRFSYGISVMFCE